MNIHVCRKAPRRHIKAFALEGQLARLLALPRFRLDEPASGRGRDESHILILDLNPIPCPAEHCTRLPTLIQSLLPAAKVHLYRSHALPVEQVSCVPDLILVRPSFRESLNGRTLRKEWNRSSVLTLFCAGWDNPKEVFQSLLNCADDFLSCPFSETDISLRIKRLLHRKTPTAAPLQAREIKQKLHLELLVGESECFQRVVEKIPPLAHSDATVVIS